MLVVGQLNNSPCGVPMEMAMADVSRFQTDSPIGGEADRRYQLWIDGVGVYLLCLKDRIVIGGAGQEPSVADVALLARLSRRHASIERTGEGYVLHAHGPCAVGQQSVFETAYLSHNTEIELGESVRLRFQLPSVLSASARLEFVSGHRPARSLDGIVLMEQTCLLGPGSENHICCANWPDSVVLFRRDGQLWCKSRGEMFVNGNYVTDGGPLTEDATVSGPDFRFRLEMLG